MMLASGNAAREDADNGNIREEHGNSLTRREMSNLVRSLVEFEVPVDESYN